MDPLSGFFRVRPRRRASSNHRSSSPFSSSQQQQQQQQQQRRHHHHHSRQYRRRNSQYLPNQLPFTELPVTRLSGFPRNTPEDELILLFEHFHNELEAQNRRATRNRSHSPIPPSLSSSSSSSRSNGVDRKILNSLPTRHLNDDDPRKNESCSVCFDSFNEGEIIELPCEHIYHRDCVWKWLKNHNTCPICRAKVSTKSKSKSNSKRNRSSPSSSSSSSLDNNRINERNNLNNNNNRDLKTRLNQMQEFIKGLGSQIERQQGIPTRDKTELNKIWETLGGWLVNDSVRQEPTIVSQIENLLETTDALKALC